MAAPTLRSLARSLGLSYATVSAALRGAEWVSPATSERVLRSAREAGYRANPLASAMMRQFRRSRAGVFRGVIAAVEIADPGRPAGAGKYHAEVLRGAAGRAAELGFKVESFVAGAGHLSLRRLDTILRAQGIVGVLLLPVWQPRDLSELDWKRYAGVYADYFFDQPSLPSVSPDHCRALVMLLRRLQALGYRRPGLVVDRGLDQRILHRWEAAYLGVGRNLPDLVCAVPVLRAKGLDRGAFLPWFERNHPDVVIGHDTEMIRWMREAGAAVPETHGFACLNVRTAERPCAGLDLQPALIGALAVEQVFHRLQRNETGPADMTGPAVSVPPLWVDGPTLRSQNGPRRPEGCREARPAAILSRRGAGAPSARHPSSCGPPPR